jgi:hypothetical protein
MIKRKLELGSGDFISITFFCVIKNEFPFHLMILKYQRGRNII